MALIRRESDATFHIHALDKRQVETGDGELTAAFLYNQPFPAVTVDGLLQDGDTLELGPYRFDVIHTPGHSPGSVSFHTRIDDLRIVIVGDTVYGGYHPKVGSSIERWETSLDKLLELDFDVFTWGHGQPSLISEGKARIQEARQQIGVYFNPWFKPFYKTFQY